jgi:hypothetical protein
MRFDNSVSEKHRAMVLDAVEAIRTIGNGQHLETVDALDAGDCEIRLVPLDQINCSGVTGLIDRRRTNRRIARGQIDEISALAEVHITFSDWTFETAGPRGVEGTLVHEGLHACDFARVISSLSKAGSDPDDAFDLTLYDLEHRAAVTSAEYLVLAGKDDYIEEGSQLGLVGIDENGQPFVDLEGIQRRMINDYKLTTEDHGGFMSKRLRLRRPGVFSQFIDIFRN